MRIAKGQVYEKDGVRKIIVLTGDDGEPLYSAMTIVDGDSVSMRDLAMKTESQIEQELEGWDLVESRC